ncbi:MAG: LLM class flavin-dependent oxidoreductase [Anaerolineae bacterium]|nr:LLM class flavin-dependent oxidoreductase [Anaerolineae bacterium]
MPVEFGIVLPRVPEKDHSISSYMANLDILLLHLAPHIRGLWVTDHFMRNEDPVHECWTLVTTLAARYHEYQVGPIVLGQSYRNPALTAKMGATLQHLSGGRFVMGIGAGWKEDEYRAYGYEFPRAGIRIEQLEDTLEIMTRLWTKDGPVSYHGKHYQIENAYCVPRPDPAPPIMVGGGGDKTMMLAARFADWWSLPDAPVEVYADRLAVLRKHCNTIQREYDDLRKTWFGRLAVAKTEAEAEAFSNGKWTRRNSLCGDPATVIAQIRAFIELGVDYFMIQVQGQHAPDTIALLTNEVFPALGL